MRRVWPIVLAVVVTASACGGGDEPAGDARSSAADATAPSGPADGTSAPGDPTQPESGAPSTAGRGAAPGGPAPAPGAAAPPSSEVPPAEQPRAIPVGPGAHGITDTSIELGMITSDAQAVASVTGGASGNDFSGSEWGFDYDKTNAAAVGLVNAMGGIAGREVKPVYYFYNAASFFSRSGRQREDQGACAQWTEDHQVFAMYGGAMTEEVLPECARQSGTPMVHVRYGFFPSASRFASMRDLWYGPHWFLADERERALAAFLRDQGFFGAGAKVGIMTEDRPDTREGVKRGMVPVLEEMGLAPAVEIVYPDPFESPWQTYVLQMQSAGVTHVLWSGMTTTAFAAMMMMRASEDQGFRPKWGIASDTAPQLLIDLGAPEAQLANALGMGWRPWWDVGDSAPQSEPARVCADALKKGGQDPSEESLGYETCEFLFFLKAALEGANELSAAGLAGAVARLGDGYPSTMTIGGVTRFAPGDHTGTVQVQPFAYDRERKAMTYRSRPAPLPS